MNSNSKIISTILGFSCLFFGNSVVQASDHDYDWRYIETFHHDNGDYRCWEAASDYYIYARSCDHNEERQEWYYNNHGEIKNRNYPDRYLTYDHDGDIYLTEYGDDYTKFRWNYVHQHFVLHYNKKCIDLNRGGGDKYHLRDCVWHLDDQEHLVEDYWWNF